MVVSRVAASYLNLRWVLCDSSGMRRGTRAGHIFQNERTAVAPVHPRDWCTGKCDNLSFLRVCLSQMASLPGSTNGYVPFLEGGVARSLMGVAL